MIVDPALEKALQYSMTEAMRAIRESRMNVKELRLVESSHRKIADLAGEVLDVLDPSRVLREPDGGSE